MTVKKKQLPKIDIVIDSRESKDIKNYLTRYQSKNYNFTTAQLKEGDFISERVIIERKTIKDLYASMNDGRLTSQLNRMSTYNEKVRVILVIGDLAKSCKEMKYYKLNVNELTLINAMASAGYRYNFQIIWAYDMKSGMRLMLSYIRGIHDGKYNQPLGAFPLVLMAQYLGVSKASMEILIEKYGSLDKLMTVPESQLIKIKGIGKTKAKQIKKRLINNIPVGKTW